MSSWLAGSFGLDPGFARGVLFVLTLALLVAVIWAVISLARSFGSGALGRQRRNRQPRLAVMDSADIDHRHRLVLVRRDHVEHLILIGGPVDVVVEEGIIRNATAAGTDTLVRSNARTSPRATFAEEGDAEAELIATAEAVAPPKPASRSEVWQPEPAAANEPPAAAKAAANGPESARPIAPPQAEVAAAEAPRRPQRSAEPGAEPRRRPNPQAPRGEDGQRPPAMRPAPPAEAASRPAPAQGGQPRPNNPASTFRRPQTPRAPMATPTAPAGGRPAPAAERAGPSEPSQPRRPEPAANEASAPAEAETRKRPSSAPDDELMAAIPTSAAVSPSPAGRGAPSPEAAAPAAQAPEPQRPAPAPTQSAPESDTTSDDAAEPDEADDEMDLDDEMARLLRGVGGR